MVGRNTPRGRIYDGVTDTIGATPLVRLARLARAFDVDADLLAKLEFFNPLGSVKDRIGVALIDALEADGTLKPDTTLIEPSSGNTGIALAFVAAARGYRLIVVMPASASIERRRMLALLGAEIELTDAALGMDGACVRAKALAAEIGDAVVPQQFENLANVRVHAETTAEEIWADCGGEIDALVVGVGTGGTLTGAAQVLKARRPSVRIVAVEPEDSAVLSGRNPGPHKIEGLGPGFTPKILDVGLIDEVLTIGNETALDMARQAARIEGVAGGISSGAALAAAIEVGQRADFAGKRIVAVLPSFAERYLSTALFDGL
jgi:cysteine synthase A